MKKIILISGICGVGKSTICKFLHNDKTLNYNIFDIDDLVNANEYNNELIYEDAINQANVLSKKDIILFSCMGPSDLEKIKIPNNILISKKILITCPDLEIRKRLKERDKKRNCSSDKFVEKQINYQNYLLNNKNKFDLHLVNFNNNLENIIIQIVEFVKR